MKKKTRVYLYKEDCSPRVFINPSDEVIIDLQKEGVVLINPNDSSIKGVPLAHTYPDVAKNMLRPTPLELREDISDLLNPMKSARRETDEKLKEAMNYLKNHKIEARDHKEEMDQKIVKLKKTLIFVDESIRESISEEVDEIYSALNELQVHTTSQLIMVELQRDQDIKKQGKVTLRNNIIQSILLVMATGSIIWTSLI